MSKGPDQEESEKRTDNEDDARAKSEMKEERREPSHGEGGSNKTDRVVPFWYRSACTTGIVRDQPDGQQRNCPGKSIQPHELRKVKIQFIRPVE